MNATRPLESSERLWSFIHAQLHGRRRIQESCPLVREKAREQLHGSESDDF
jgi:hypothetical protein